MTDFTLYLITHELGKKSFNVILQAIEGGVKIVQLRNKTASTKQLLSAGQQLLSILRPKGIPLIINDNLEVAMKLNADGLHVGQSDVTVNLARTRLGKKSIIGLSVETMDQAINAQKLDVDYLAASPVFYSKTKPLCGVPWGLEGLKRLCDFSRHPVIAIGGIDETNCKQVKECGVAGIAVASAILNAANPKKAAQNILEPV